MLLDPQGATIVSSLGRVRFAIAHHTRADRVAVTVPAGIPTGV